MLDMGSRRPESQTAMKNWNESCYTGATRASELHDHLSRHHRTPGKDVHMPVGDMLKVEG